GSPQLVTVSEGAVLAYDITSGTRVWSHPVELEQAVPSMVRSGDVLWVGGGTHGPKVAVGLRLTGESPAPSVDTLWDSTQAVPECSSPVLYKGLLFAVTLNGVMYCQDAVSGKVHWRKRLPSGRYFSSLVAGDGKVYATNEAGVTTVLAASPTYKVLGK